MNNAAEMTYDVRDRIVTTKQAGASSDANIEYSIQDNMFKQKQIDENDHFATTYTDIRGRQRKVVQNDQLTTTFTYNAINELIKVIDNAGFETRYKYDFAGRKTEVCHPDRGVSKFTYNKAGQVTKLSTANLAAVSGSPTINYSYNWNRLLQVTYPLNPENNVKYTYGTWGNAQDKSFNAIGRVIMQEDGTGVQLFTYGCMGEVTGNLKSVVVAGSQPYWFYT